MPRAPSMPLVALLALAVAACQDREPTAAAAESRTVATGMYPMAYFARRIGGGDVTVVCVCPGDADPIAWMPSREAAGTLQGAALVVLNGAGYEAWASVVSLPLSRVVDTAASFRGEHLTFPTMTHNHGPGGPHTHQGTDGHTWMDPRLAVVQAEEVRAAFARRWPEGAAGFSARADGLRDDLMVLDARLAEIAGRARGASIVASHPAYQYIARRYGLTIPSVDLPPDMEPTEAQWAAAEHAFAGATRRILLFESEPLPATAAGVRARLHAVPVTFDPCEQPGEGEYPARMNANLDRLQAALEPEA